MLKIETQSATKLSEQELKIKLEELKGEQRKLELLLAQQHEKDMQQTEIAAEAVQQEREIEAKAEQQETAAELAEAQRQNQVRDQRVDSAIERAHAPKETT